MGGSAGSVRVLVTGGHGFVGRRLRTMLAIRQPTWTVIAPPGPADVAERVDCIDISDPLSVAEVIKVARPDIVVHLAAIAAVTASAAAPREAWRVNLGGTLNVVTALQEHAISAHLLFVSSAEVYGASLNDDKPVGEDALLQPLNPYAASKAAADILVRQAAATGLSAVTMRPFNHTGPGQSEAFVAPNFAGQIARIEAGLQPPVLSVGSVDDERDFLDVDDVVEAYIGVLEAGDRIPSGTVLNVASGRSVRIGALLESLLASARVPIQIKVDPSRLRRAATPRVVGNATRLRAETGWQPKIELEDTLARILADRRLAFGVDTNGV